MRGVGGSNTNCYCYKNSVFLNCVKLVIDSDKCYGFFFDFLFMYFFFIISYSDILYCNYDPVC